MSGGGNGQMPTASNQGQQMQNPQMGQQGNMGQMPPPGGMFGQPQIAQQMPGGPQMDQSMLQKMIQARQMQGAGGGMQPAMGIAGLGVQPMQIGTPMEYASPRFTPQGEMNPYQQNPNQVDMRTTNMGQPSAMNQPSSMTQPSSMGAMPSYRPTMGPINGAEVASRMDIRQPRQMAGLPNSIANQLPPSLKRPTQGSYKNFK